MRAVICDDDPTLRSVVSRLAEAADHTVIAETDSADDAVELVSRFGADLLVLDLSLPWGSGMRAVRALRERGSTCRVVLFTAYPSDAPDVRDASVWAVVEKPNFDELERVLGQLARGAVATPAKEHERRRPWRERSRIELPVVPSPSGLEDPESFAKVVECLEPSDAVLVVHLTPVEDERSRWHDLLATDRLLAIARELRILLRIQDRLSVLDDGPLVALLLDAGHPGVDSVWKRLEAAQQRARITGVLSGGWAAHEETALPVATVSRARGAAGRSLGQPPGDRLWAG